MKQLEWTDPHEILARGALSFLYFSRVVDDAGFEYRYIGKTEDGAKRLRAYPRNVRRIFHGLPRRVTPGQGAYRAVHLAIARAIERGWHYEFYPLEEVPAEQIVQIETQRKPMYNLNDARKWRVGDYSTVDLRGLLKVAA